MASKRKRPMRGVAADIDDENRVSGHEWLWYTAIILTAVLTIAIGYYTSIAGAVLFYLVAILLLLALRPNDH